MDNNKHNPNKSSIVVQLDESFTKSWWCKSILCNTTSNSYEDDKDNNTIDTSIVIYDCYYSVQFDQQQQVRGGLRSYLHVTLACKVCYRERRMGK